MSFAPISKELALAGTEVPHHEATREGGEGRPVATPLDPPWIQRLFQQHGERRIGDGRCPLNVRNRNGNIELLRGGS